MAGIYLIVWSWFFLSLVSKISSQDFPWQGRSKPERWTFRSVSSFSTERQMRLNVESGERGGERNGRCALVRSATGSKGSKVSPLTAITVVPDTSGGWTGMLPLLCHSDPGGWFLVLGVWPLVLMMVPVFKTHKGTRAAVGSQGVEGAPLPPPQESRLPHMISSSCSPSQMLCVGARAWAAVRVSPTSKPHSTLSGFLITTECSINHKSQWKKDNYYPILDSLFLVFFSFLLFWNFFKSFRNYVYGWPRRPKPKTLTISGAGVAGCWKALVWVLVTKLRGTAVAHALNLWAISPLSLSFYPQCWEPSHPCAC